MARKIQQTTEMKNIQDNVSDLIGKLLSFGLTQDDLAENLQLYQPEVSQLFRKVRLLKIDRFKEIEKILKKLVEENVNPTEQTGAIIHEVKPEYNFGTWLYDQLTKLEITPIEFAAEATLSYQTINLIVTGLTSNPQFRTKNLINTTLDRLGKERKKKIDKIDLNETTDEERLFIGIPYLKNEIDQTPDLIGIYAIHDKRGYPTYIGKGKIKTRLKDHSDRIAFASDKVAATFSYYQIQIGQDEKAKTEADRQAKLWEKILTKFAGNTILLNIQNTEDLSRSTD
ncbi:MAG: GIY-YIG nuclease family protein [Bacteroidota bacterium]